MNDPELSPYQQASRRFACNHPATDLTYLVARDGSIRYRLQCRGCGEKVKDVGKADLTSAQISRAVPFDEAKKEARRRQISDYAMTLYTKQREAEDRTRRRQYEDHLNSEKWQRLRELVLKRAGGTCEGCGIRPAVQVHHLTYEHLGDEFLWELRAICIECHERIHGRSFDETPKVLMQGSPDWDFSEI